MKEFKIGKRKIGQLNDPFIIAELSANHGNSLQNCIKLVKIAKKAELMRLKFKLIYQIQLR